MHVSWPSVYNSFKGLSTKAVVRGLVKRFSIEYMFALLEDLSSIPSTGTRCSQTPGTPAPGGLSPLTLAFMYIYHTPHTHKRNSKLNIDRVAKAY